MLACATNDQTREFPPPPPKKWTLQTHLHTFPLTGLVTEEDDVTVFLLILIDFVVNDSGVTVDLGCLFTGKLLVAPSSFLCRDTTLPHSKGVHMYVHIVWTSE